LVTVHHCPRRNDVSGIQPVLCRLAEQAGPAKTQVLQNRSRGAGLRGYAKGESPPSKARGVTVADALAPFLGGNPRTQHTTQVARAFAEAHGQTGCKQLGNAHAAFLNAWLNRYENAFSKHRRAGAAKRILRYLAEEFDAPRLHDKITKVTKPKPRNVTATAEERAAMIAAAPPALRCWLLLCSDCAIRSGTAARLTPAEYDPAERLLTFRTKYQNAQRVPVTEQLAALLDACGDPALPFVQQLARGPVQGQKVGTMSYQILAQTFGRLKRRIGITRKLTPHDLRRTTARRVYEITRDLRTVQSLLGHSDLPATAWYLQDAMVRVPLEALELAKLNPLTERPQ
jgi:integrase